MGVHKACDSPNWKLHGKIDKRKEGMSIFIMYYMHIKTKKNIKMGGNAIKNLMFLCYTHDNLPPKI